MPKEKFTTPEVNLLPSDDLEAQAGGKFLNWALSWGKKIVILTELIVVLAFLSRFKLDTDVANLSDQIDQKKAIILASADFEKQFSYVSLQINKAKEIDNTVSVLLILDKAKALVPGTVTVSQISVSKLSVSISGSGSDPDLAAMVAAFKSTPSFKDVSMTRVSAVQGVSGINFSLSATYVSS